MRSQGLRNRSLIGSEGEQLSERLLRSESAESTHQGSVIKSHISLKILKLLSRVLAIGASEISSTLAEPSRLRALRILDAPTAIGDRGLGHGEVLELGLAHTSIQRYGKIYLNSKGGDSSYFVFWHCEAAHRRDVYFPASRVVDTQGNELSLLGGSR